MWWFGRKKFICKKRGNTVHLTTDTASFKTIGARRRARLDGSLAEADTVIVNGEIFGIRQTVCERKARVTRCVEIPSPNECNQWPDGSCHCDKPEQCRNPTYEYFDEEALVPTKTYIATHALATEEYARSYDSWSDLVAQLLERRGD